MPPGTRNALVPPSPNYLRDAGQFVGGVGRGLANQFVVSPLQMVQQSYEDPYSLGQGIYEGARSLAADPVGVVGNSLRGMWNRAKSSPAGLGQVVGENIDPRNFLKPRKGMRQELDVYHGTPHTFDPETGAPLGRFRSEKIGTGEGAQAYGYGLYFAESPGVAKSYKDKLTPSAAVPNAAANSLEKMNPNLYARLERIAKESGYTVSAINRMVVKPNEFREIDAALKREILDFKKSAKGALYKVDLPDAKIEQMLDWDKPLAEQPEAVRKALSSHPKVIAEVNRLNEQRVALNEQNPERLSHPVIGKLARKEYTAESLKGQALYELFSKGSNQAQASEYMRSLGIPGIKYLDAGSRSGEKGTRNFVVFPGEEQSLNILSRD
jgi:hypothetical protein